MNGTADFIKKWWVQIVFIVAAIVWFAQLQFTVEAMQGKYEQALVEIKQDVRQIRNDQVRIMIRMGIEL